jgi:hypothetical protein
MVTCAFPAVVTVKPDVDVPLTVPAVPPGAGPDRALEPPDPKWPANPLLAADEPPPEDEPPLVTALVIP